MEVERAEAFIDFMLVCIGDTQINYLFCGRSSSLSVGTCRGDSGAPGIFKGRLRDPFIQMGVLHGSSGDNCDNSKLPSIFVRLDDPDILKWIRKTVENEQTTGRFL